MKNIFLSILVLFFCLNIYTQNPLECVNHELFADSETAFDIWGYGDPSDYPGEHNTFRIYAYLDDANSVMQSVIGVPSGLETYIGTDHPLGQIWNYQYGGTLGNSAVPDFFIFYSVGATPMFDSYVTIGSENSQLPAGQNPITFGTGSSNIPAEEYWGNSVYSDADNPDFIMTGDAWLLGDVTGTNAYGIGPEFRVLIAQITTIAEDIHYGLNITALTDVPLSGGQTWITYWDASGLGGTSFNETYNPCMGLKYPSDAIFGCMNLNACNYNSLAICNKGITCVFPGCTDETACNYEFAAGCDDGSCLYNPGCIDSNACNYSSLSDCDDGSCTYPGCTDPAACNYDSSVLCESGNCLYGFGCTEEEAVNYNSNVGCNDGSCVYTGCINSLALNYNPNANTDDGSCYFGINGHVFLDGDENGQQSLGEPGMENWRVDIVSLGLCAYTSDGGYFEFPNLPEGSYELTIEEDEDWDYTTPSSAIVSTSAGTSTSSTFGLIPFNDDYSFFNTQECCIFAPFIHCENGFWPGVWFHNDGTAALNGEITMEWSDELAAEPQWSSIVPDVLESGYCQWTLDDYSSGSSDIFRIHILGPGFELMGQSFGFTINFTFYDFNGEDVFEASIYIEPVVVCAYDPNDKYAIPPGFAEPHFILEEDVIQYRIRFQNTGNWFAEDVVVLDTLSPLLDYSTFEPLFASHNMMTNFDSETGEVSFNLQEIFLPDSTNNEPESHGYIVYNIRPLEGLDPGTVIENTAYIYFDANPAVVTNTEFHTIYECSEISFFDPMPEQLCQGETIVFENDQDYIENYNWQFNGGTVSTENNMDIDFVGPGTIEISLSVDNPICESTTDLLINVTELPSANAEDVEICDGETAVLLATGGDFYLWNTEDTTSEIEVTPSETTSYSVIVSDIYDCSDETSAIVTVLESPNAVVTENSEICEGESVQLSANGGITYEWNTDETTPNIEVSPEETTEYAVTVFNEFDCSDEASVLVTVIPLPEASFSESGTLLTAVEADAYQWYLNGEVIIGATQQTYTAEENGDYSVEVWNEVDCSSISEEITVTIISVGEMDLYGFNLYPNPITDASILEFKKEGIYEVKIFDLLGKMVRDYGESNSDYIEIKKNNLASGNYQIWIQQEGKIWKITAQIR